MKEVKIKKKKAIKKTSKKGGLIRRVKKLLSKKKKTPIKKSSLPKKKRTVTKRKKKTTLPEIVRAEKFDGNPIIKPSLYFWETKATFNPAAFLLDNKINLIYRAIGENDVSMLGYAYTYDGYNIEGRPTYSIYQRYLKPDKTKPNINYISGGGGFGGCEDPRATIIDDNLYLIYVAFDGWSSIGLNLSSISLEDFRKRRWNNWSKPITLSHPGEIHKNWVLFPEKINGKFAILHSISPDILIHYFDSFKEFDGKNFIQSIHRDHPKWQEKEPGVRGAGPTPIKTRLGWLVLYHRTEAHDPHKYKIFAKILDREDPTKVLYQTDHAIIEPDQGYEMEGYRGIVYSCGAVVKNETLFVYYGAGDKYVGVATIKLDDLLDNMANKKEIKLSKTKKK